MCVGIFCPRATKGLPPFESAHSKTVKRAIALMCLESSIQKCCTHRMQTSFDSQVSRLLDAGYPRSLLSAESEALLQKLKRKRVKPQVIAEKTRPEVVSYSHKVAHNLKRVATKYRVPIVFSAPRKLGGLCSRISGKKKSDSCGKKHATKYVGRKVGTLYQIPLMCDKVYIGQSGRCINYHLRAHDLSIKNGTGSHLPIHGRNCGCTPRLKETIIMDRSRDTVERELAEA